jgi:hypothetical protein
MYVTYGKPVYIFVTTHKTNQATRIYTLMYTMCTNCPPPSPRPPSAASQRPDCAVRLRGYTPARGRRPCHAMPRPGRTAYAALRHPQRDIAPCCAPGRYCLCPRTAPSPSPWPRSRLWNCSRWLRYPRRGPRGKCIQYTAYTASQPLYRTAIHMGYAAKCTDRSSHICTVASTWVVHTINIEHESTYCSVFISVCITCGRGHEGK